MRSRSALFAAILSCAFAGRSDIHAQQPTPAAVPVLAGDQLAIDLLNRIAGDARRIEPMLDQIHVQEWIAKGAAETYSAQLASAKQQIHAVGTEMMALTQRP